MLQPRLMLLELSQLLGGLHGRCAAAFPFRWRGPQWMLASLLLLEIPLGFGLPPGAAIAAVLPNEVEFSLAVLGLLHLVHQHLRFYLMLDGFSFVMYL